MREIIQAISQARDSEAVEKTGDRNAQIDKVIELLEKLKE